MFSVISLESFISFVSLSLLLAISPGPSNAFLMAQTFAKGKQAGMKTAYGFATAGVIHTPVWLAERAKLSGAVVVNINPNQGELDKISDITFRKSASEYFNE